MASTEEIAALRASADTLNRFRESLRPDEIAPEMPEIDPDTQPCYSMGALNRIVKTVRYEALHEEWEPLRLSAGFYFTAFGSEALPLRENYPFGLIPDAYAVLPTVPRAFVSIVDVPEGSRTYKKGVRNDFWEIVAPKSPLHGGVVIGRVRIGEELPEIEGNTDVTELRHQPAGEHRLRSAILSKIGAVQLDRLLQKVEFQPVVEAVS